MITEIITQNKRALINKKDVLMVFVNDSKNPNEVAVMFKGGDVAWLGTYSSEEKAIAVIDMMVRSRDTLFYMPQDNMVNTTADKWIPCSVRQPSIEGSCGEYFLTTDLEHVTPRVYYYSAMNGTWYTDIDCSTQVQVIAWMEELPETYR